MPTYEYKCDDCGKKFEVFKSIKDESIPSCPECNSHNTIHLISATSFILKGSGWYMTDYGNKRSPSSSKTPESKDKAEPTETKTKEKTKTKTRAEAESA